MIEGSIFSLKLVLLEKKVKLQAQCVCNALKLIYGFEPTKLSICLNAFSNNLLLFYVWILIRTVSCTNFLLTVAFRQFHCTDLKEYFCDWSCHEKYYFSQSLSKCHTNTVPSKNSLKKISVLLGNQV